MMSRLLAPRIGRCWRGAPATSVGAALAATVVVLSGACGTPGEERRGPEPAHRVAPGESIPMRQSFHMDVPAPPIPVVIGGVRHLVYELRLLNFAAEPLRIERLAVVDAHDGTALADLGPGDLETSLGRPGAAPSDAAPLTLDPGGVGIVYLEVPTGNGASSMLQHRVSYRAEGAAGIAEVRGALTPIRSQRPALLSPPVRGGPWVAVYHPSWERGHRRVVYAVNGRARIPGRFAVDWFRVDSAGRHAAPPEDAVGEWFGYGAEVLAVAEGVVAAVRTDMPESPTRSGRASPALADATGNYVALDIGEGRFAFYEHLQPGSIRVQVGDRVERGQVIAAIGFTGSTSGPHLHFHVGDGNDPLGAEGLPFVLDRFEVLGAYGPSDMLVGAPWGAPLDGAGGMARRGAAGAQRGGRVRSAGRLRARRRAALRDLRPGCRALDPTRGPRFTRTRAGSA